MFQEAAVKEKILELYPDIRRFGIALAVRKDRLVSARHYELTLEKDTRKTHVRLGVEDVRQCMAGVVCALVTTELARFVRQFIDEEHAAPEAG